LAGAAPAWGGGVYPVEIEGGVYDLMKRFGGLKPGQMDDWQAVSAARELTSRCVGKAPIVELQLRA
jgi:hypothetical protein